MCSLLCSSKSGAKVGTNNLKRLKDFDVSEDSVIFSAINVIPASVFKSGVATDAQISRSFDDLAKEGLEKDLVPEEQGTFLYLFGTLLSKTVVRPSERVVEGDSTDAIISRARAAVQKKNLSNAVTELSGLDPRIRVIFDEWIKQAKERIYVENALNVVRSHAKTLN